MSSDHFDERDTGFPIAIPDWLRPRSGSPPREELPNRLFQAWRLTDADRQLLLSPQSERAARCDLLLAIYAQLNVLYPHNPGLATRWPRSPNGHFAAALVVIAVHDGHDNLRCRAPLAMTDAIEKTMRLCSRRVDR